MHLENSILIKESVNKSFEVVADVEKWPEFLSLHKHQKIISKDKDSIVIDRGGRINWRLYITIDGDKKTIVSRQIRGPAKGLEARWRFEETPLGTRMVLTHTLDYKIPLIGRMIELISAHIIKKLTSNTLISIKERVETG